MDFSFLRSRLRLLAAAFALALCLTACGGSSNSFTWRVETLPANLDPQLAQTSSDITACLNLYSGLFRLDSEGVPQPECCESYQVSADKTVYTFTLREGLRYVARRGAETDHALTAEDFAFGLYRVFLPATGSPYADDLAIIQGSDEVLGGAPRSALGVEAVDDRTLRITLREPDPDFLRKLCLPGAMPCNEAYFNSTGGAYGLSAKTVLSNGPYYLYNWTDNGLFLWREGTGSQVTALRIVLDQDDVSVEKPLSPPDQVLSGKADAALYSGFTEDSLTAEPYTTITWSLVYNTRLKGLSHPSVRLGLSRIAQQTSLPLQSYQTPAASLVPPSVTLAGAPYRNPNLADNALLSGREDYRFGLEALGLSTIRGLTVLVPEDETVAALFDAVNQDWQSQLALYCNVHRLPMDELRRAVNSGSFDIALVPISAGSNSPLAYLEQFGPGNVSGWADEDWQTSLEALSRQLTLFGSSQDIYRLESVLLSGGPVAPLFYQQQQLLVSPAVSGYIFDPFAQSLDLTYACKEN